MAVKIDEMRTKNESLKFTVQLQRDQSNSNTLVINRCYGFVW